VRQSDSSGLLGFVRQRESAIHSRTAKQSAIDTRLHIRTESRSAVNWDRAGQKISALIGNPMVLVIGSDTA
jgi:hypothetical protein